MSDTGIFLFGLFVSTLLGGGMVFTVLEVRRIERKNTERANKVQNL